MRREGDVDVRAALDASGVGVGEGEGELDENLVVNIRIIVRDFERGRMVVDCLWRGGAWLASAVMRVMEKGGMRGNGRLTFGPQASRWRCHWVH